MRHVVQNMSEHEESLCLFYCQLHFILENMGLYYYECIQCTIHIGQN